MIFSSLILMLGIILIVDSIVFKILTSTVLKTDSGKTNPLVIYILVFITFTLFLILLAIAL